jgi:hypothetical protein
MQNGAKMIHDLSGKSWGCNYNVMQIHDGGMRVDLAGWHSGIKNGDFLILKRYEGTTRYLVESIRYESDPSDMWFAKVSFAPRED